MIIKAVKFRKDGFYTQSIAFTGKDICSYMEPKEKFNKA